MTHVSHARCKAPFVQYNNSTQPFLTTAAFSISVRLWRIDEQSNLQKSMISKRFVLYFDTCEVQSRKHVKTLLCGVLQCVCACVYIHMCVHTPLCEWKKLALKAILSLWSLWWNLWRGKARGLFCKSGRSVSDCERMHLPLLNTPALSYIRQQGKGIWSSVLDSSTLLKQPRQNSSMVVC